MKCYMRDILNSMRGTNDGKSFEDSLLEGLTHYTDLIRDAITGYPVPDMPLIIASMEKTLEGLKTLLDPNEIKMAQLFSMLVGSEMTAIKVPPEEDDDGE